MTFLPKLLPSNFIVKRASPFSGYLPSKYVRRYFEMGFNAIGAFCKLTDLLPAAWKFEYCRGPYGVQYIFQLSIIYISMQLIIDFMLYRIMSLLHYS